ncbi:MAG: N-acetyltransferase family protein [Sulfitobacter sp.]
MKIRAARSADAAAIAALWNDMIRDTLATFTTKEKSTVEISAMISERPASCWLATKGDAVLGFVTYGPFRGGPGYAATVEHTIILDIGAQGQGAGRKLMQHAIEVAQQQGHHVMVAAISGANPGAVAFHQRLGFEQVAQMAQVGRKGGQWLDLILMQKIVSAP